MFVSLAAAFAVGCGSSNSSTPASPTPTPTVTGPSVSMVAGASLLTSTAYSPGSLTVARGSSVTFVNNDNTSHTATASGQFDTGLINPGSSKTVTLSTAGTVTYHCTIHPGMTGTLIVQ
ncbi:MAG TPA: plastocyanin/azurin family copper-binding protein [Vicinamibacterales bacterium]|nr:plastocyanin/azurin family copper-binding protein [Vicinamibacterales bacterium]